MTRIRQYRAAGVAVPVAPRVVPGLSVAVRGSAAVVADVVVVAAADAVVDSELAVCMARSEIVDHCQNLEREVAEVQR